MSPTVQAEAWRAVCPFPFGDQWVARLYEAYASPPRAYHSFEHIREVVEQFSLVRDWRQPNEVFAAVLGHDVIYVAGAKDNEARSAEWMCSLLKQAGLDTLMNLERVGELILLTARHGRLQPADLAMDPDAARFLDCDMAILGAPPARFAEYDAAVATEYRGAMSALTFATAYKMGRAKFLKQLLASERIYLSDEFHKRLDAAARLNLRQALAG